jgi:uncharacterized protein YaiE (UPF0345 family)
MNSEWADIKKQWPNAPLALKASSQVTTAGRTTGVDVGKGKYALVFTSTVNSNATGESLRCEVQANRYTTKDLNVTSKVVWDADFVTSNTIDVSVGGVSATQVTFATSHANTMTLVIAAVEAIANISCELDATDANGRTILITKDGRNTAIGTVVEAVAAGAGQADGTITYDEDWYTIGVFIWDDDVQGSVTSDVGSYPLIVDNPNDYQLAIKHTLISTPDVTYKVDLYPLEAKK